MSDPKNLLPSDRALRRDELADRIASVVLEHGLESLALRGLAERLDTSGRMLLYYFGTKDALVVAALGRVSARLYEMLAQRPAAERLTPGAFLSAALAMTADPAMAPYMRVWTEVIARGARGEEPFRGIASETVAAWLAWVESRLVAGEAGRAGAILSIMEGFALVEAARPGATEEGRVWLKGVLFFFEKKNQKTFIY